jgi:hypothetical protein
MFDVLLVVRRSRFMMSKDNAEAAVKAGEAKKAY